MNYDVIVIGAGMGGLTTALTLAKSGKSVGVFERHYIPGGYATNFVRKGKNGHIYVFDSTLHALAGSGKDGAIYPILNHLELLNKIDLIKNKDCTSLVINNKTFDIYFNFTDFKNFLINNFPNLTTSIHEIFKIIKSLVIGTKASILGNDSTDTTDTIKNLQSITVKDFLNKYTNNEEFIELFGFLWSYLGLPISELNAFYYLSAMGSYLLGDTYYIKHGSGHLSKIMADEIEKYGGKVHLLSEIIDIKIEDKKIVSIIRKNGDMFTAEEFIFACDPNRIFSLINSTNEEIIKYINNIKSLEKSMSASQLYLAIDCSTKEVGINNPYIFINKCNSSTFFNNIKNGNLNNLSVVITSYDKMDPSLNKHGAFLNIATVDFASNWPEHGTEEYKAKKEEVTQLLLNELYSMFPKIKDHIQVVELGTPRTMERYTNNSGGSIYGWAQNTKQGGFNRPSFKTPFDNAIVVGAWSFPGGGYSGAMLSGYLGAQRLLAKENAPKSSDILVSIEALMNGLVKRFNPENAEGLDITYKFVFEGHNPIYLEVKNKTARLLSKSEIPEKIDTTISTTHEVWQKIAFNQISGQDALMDGLINYEGSLKYFASIPKIFDKV